MRPRRPPTLVHITTVPQTLGFLRGQARYMRDRGFDVQFVSSPGQRLDALGAEEGVLTHPVSMQRRISPLRDVVGLARLYVLLRRTRPTIVHAHTPKGGLLGMAAAWLARVPVRVYHVHGLPLTTAAGVKRRLLTLSERVSCQLARRVLCVGPSVLGALVELGLCPENKATVLGAGTVNGIDARARFCPDRLPPSARFATRREWGVPPDGFVLGYVGRIVHDKGIEDLVAAWLLVREAYPSTHLVMAGEFELQDPISADCLELLHSCPRVHLLGHVDDMPQVFSAMDLVVLATHREGFPYVPMEAAAMGLPVIGTQVVGCVDAIVDGVTGTLVPPYDAMALAQAIMSYLHSADLRSQHGQAGRLRVLREFRPEEIWEATYQEYVRMLRETGQPVPDRTAALP